MKLALFLILLAFTSLSWAASDWKVVAETVKCADKLKVLAKEGEKFVYVVQGEKKTQLVSEDGSPYSSEAGSAVTFTNSHDKSSNQKYSFLQPSMVDGNPPKIKVGENGVKDHCRMKLK